MLKALLADARPAPATRGQDQEPRSGSAYRTRHPNRVRWALCGLEVLPSDGAARIGSRCARRRANAQNRGKEVRHASP